LLTPPSGGGLQRLLNHLLGSRTGHRCTRIRANHAGEGVLPGCGGMWAGVDLSITLTGGAGHEGVSSKRSRAVQDCPHHGRELSATHEGKVNRFNAVGVRTRDNSTQRGVIRSARVYLNARPIMRGSRTAPAKPSIANNKNMLRTRRTVVACPG
jgi:hypothetical protein